MNNQNFNYTRWNCKYHIIFVPNLKSFDRKPSFIFLVCYRNPRRWTSVASLPSGNVIFMGIIIVGEKNVFIDGLYVDIFLWIIIEYIL